MQRKKEKIFNVINTLNVTLFNIYLSINSLTIFKITVNEIYFKIKLKYHMFKRFLLSILIVKKSKLISKKYMNKFRFITFFTYISIS